MTRLFAPLSLVYMRCRSRYLVISRTEKHRWKHLGGTLISWTANIHHPSLPMYRSYEKAMDPKGQITIMSERGDGVHHDSLISRPVECEEASGGNWKGHLEAFERLIIPSRDYNICWTEKIDPVDHLSFSPLWYLIFFYHFNSYDSYDIQSTRTQQKSYVKIEKSWGYHHWSAGLTALVRSVVGLTA